MDFSRALLYVSYSLFAAAIVPARGEILVLSSVGEDFIQTPGGFVPYTFPPYTGGNTQLHIGRWQSGIEDGFYRAAVEFDLRPIPSLAQITSATLRVLAVRGTTSVGVYYGDGVITFADTGLLVNTFLLPVSNSYALVDVDVTPIFNAFRNIGAPWLGFTAYQDPTVTCDNGLSGRTDDSCLDRFSSSVAEYGYRPVLSVDYTLPTPPPPGPEPIPEPSAGVLAVCGLTVLEVRKRLLR